MSKIANNFSPNLSSLTNELGKIYPRREKSSFSSRRLYKYMKSNHAEAAISAGQFRVGTLKEYIKVEYNDEITDKDEGMKSIVLSGINEELLTPEYLSENYPYIYKKLKDSYQMNNFITQFNLHECALGLTELTNDHYVYSMSSTYDPVVMKQFGYDACICIFNPEGFLSELTKSLGDAVKIFKMGNCVYRNRWHGLDAYEQFAKTPAALLKTTEYAHQKEVRAFWKPTADEIQPLIVNSLKASKYCRLYS